MAKGSRGRYEISSGHPWELPDYLAKPHYKSFVESHAAITAFKRPVCWACGNTESSRPALWGAPFLIERAHITNRPRKEDRRSVNLLCSLCHKKQHGESFSFCKLPRLTLENMLWLKMKADPLWYDEAFLRRCSIRALPDPEEPEMHRQVFHSRWRCWW